MEEDDSLFVSSEPFKIKKEPGLESEEDSLFVTSLDFPTEPEASSSNSIQQNLQEALVKTTSTDTKKNSGSSKSKKASSSKSTRSTSETLNALYEGDNVIAFDATPELVLNDEDGEDEVVEEYPMYYSTELLQKLYILQYPTRPATRPFVDVNGTGILDSRIKPEGQAIEVDVPIDTTKFYDKEKAENWGNVDKQTYGGIAKHVPGYMIGVFKDNALHLNPVHATAQLRPQFHYASQAGQAQNNSTDKEKEAAQTKRAPKAVQLTAKIVGDNAPSFSGALIATKKLEDESFIGMDWYDRDSEESWDIADSLIAKKRDPLVEKTTKDEYIASISSPHVDPVAVAAANFAAKQKAEMKPVKPVRTPKATPAKGKQKATPAKATSAKATPAKTSTVKKSQK